MFTKLDDRVSVSGQITPGDIVLLKKEGFTAFICNRPDDEEFNQPSFDAVKAVADAQGCSLDHIPVGADGISMETIKAFRKAMLAADGPVLAYCRSGMRSCALWALASSVDKTTEEIITVARNAGYALDQLAGMIESLHRLGHIPDSD